MIASEVLFSQLEDRIDAGFYATKIHIEEQLKTKALNFEPMETLCDFPKAKTPPQDGYIDSGIPVLKLKNITDYFIDWSEVSFVPERLYSNLFQPKKGDLLITATGEGTIGRVNIFDEDKKCIVTGEVMIVRPNPQKVNPYFLLTYLRCKYGKPLLIRFVRGATGQTHLYSKDVKQILAPIPPPSFQEHVERLVKEAHEKRKLADQRYKEAEQLLYKELGIGKLELTRKKTFETTFSEVEKTARFDSEYYQPKYDQNIENVRNSKFKNVKLGTLIEGIKYGTSEKVDYSESGIPFLRVTDINSFNTIDIEDIKRIPEYELSRVKNATIREKIKVDKINPLYLSIFLNSQLGKLQTQRETSGAIQTNITIPIIKSLRIIVPDTEIQDKICDVYMDALQIRDASRRLIDQAKTEVEELIEGNRR